MSHPFHTFGHPKPVATGLLVIDYRVEHREPFLALASADLRVRVLGPGGDAL